jgi:protein CpxP
MLPSWMLQRASHQQSGHRGVPEHGSSTPLKQNDIHRNRADTQGQCLLGTIKDIFNTFLKGTSTMKTWIKRSLIGLAASTVLVGGLAACGSRGDHARGWSEERVSEMRSKAIERISNKLELNADQKQKLGLLADEMIASRKALRGAATDPRAELKALVAGEKFDRNQAQALLDQKMQVVQGKAPQMLSAFGNFYDSLNAEQQKEIRERIEKRGHGWWGRG